MMLKVVKDAMVEVTEEVEDDDQEWWALAKRSEENLDFLVGMGVFKKELSEAERSQLLSPLAYHILEDMVIISSKWRNGLYPRPGQPLLSIEIYGLFDCFYRDERGVILVYRLGDEVFKSAPIIRLYVNGVLVGLSILGELVLDYYSEYFDWLTKMGQGVTFTF